MFKHLNYAIIGNYSFTMQESLELYLKGLIFNSL